jgi:hypothetical protein
MMRVCNIRWCGGGAAVCRLKWTYAGTADGVPPLNPTGNRPTRYPHPRYLRETTQPLPTLQGAEGNHFPPPTSAARCDRAFRRTYDKTSEAMNFIAFINFIN